MGSRCPASEHRSTQAAVVPPSVSSCSAESDRTRSAERDRTDPRRRGRTSTRAPSASARAATSGGAQAPSSSPRRSASVSASYSGTVTSRAGRPTMPESTRVRRPTAPGAGRHRQRGRKTEAEGAARSGHGVPCLLAAVGAQPRHLVVGEPERGLEHVQDPQLGRGRLPRGLGDAHGEPEGPDPLGMGGEAVGEHPEPLGQALLGERLDRRAEVRLGAGGVESPGTAGRRRATR